jgi:hypothetical protein
MRRTDGAWHLGKECTVSAAQQRRAMVAGMVFVVLFVAGVILTFGDSPNIKSSDTGATAAQKWLTEISHSGQRAGLVIGAYVLIVAAIAFVWFCSGVREWVATDATMGRAISSLAVLGAGAIAAGSMTGGAAIAGSKLFGNEPLPASGDTLHAISQLFFPLLFVVFGLVSSCLSGTIATCARRSGRAPSWLVWAGWVGSIASLAGVVFFPFILVLLWYLALAIVGFTRAGASPGGAAAHP